MSKKSINYRKNDILKSTWAKTDEVFDSILFTVFENCSFTYHIGLFALPCNVRALLQGLRKG